MERSSRKRKMEEMKVEDPHQSNTEDRPCYRQYLDPNIVTRYIQCVCHSEQDKGPKIKVPPEVSIYIVATLEYLATEIVELSYVASRIKRPNRKDVVLSVQDLKHAIDRDEELWRLLDPDVDLEPAKDDVDRVLELREIIGEADSPEGSSYPSSEEMELQLALGHDCVSSDNRCRLCYQQ